MRNVSSDIFSHIGQNVALRRREMLNEDTVGAQKRRAAEESEVCTGPNAALKSELCHLFRHRLWTK